jgi:hypothetical protein
VLPVSVDNEVPLAGQQLAALLALMLGAVGGGVIHKVGSVDETLAAYLASKPQHKRKHYRRPFIIYTSINT